ncbi:MAG TPA: ribonuclease HII [Candidatus Binatia bacterium]|nr:ribonuclease HII [Candidatus Binatia bacterium]
MVRPLARAEASAPRGRSAPPNPTAEARFHRLRLDPDLSEERRLRALGFRFVAGVDEVGRGCLAGPVTAAAVILPPNWVPDGLRDSKLLRAPERERLAAEVRAGAVAWAVASVWPPVIDRINILQATLLAANLAAGRLPVRPDALILDGSLAFPEVPLPQRVVVDADRLCASVAAASVLAKVERDRLMVELDAVYPGYGLATNKGYAAPEHRAALARLGLSPIHRRSFASCAEIEQLDLWLAEVGAP